MLIDEIFDKDNQEYLIEIVRGTIKQDDELRQQYDVKNKFRFIQERLHELVSLLEKNVQISIEELEKHVDPVLLADEQMVYVYLFNAHGSQLRTWQNMLISKVFYEYSVNRPIYGQKEHVESMIKAKSSRTQHGYLVIAVKMEDILKSDGAASQVDAYGNPILKVREGSLHFSRLISFIHNEIDYFVNEKGELFKKEE